MKPNQRIHYIDVLNCIAIMFVLLLHSSQLANVGSKNSTFYLLTKLMQIIFIPAVYIFFMNSGATLLNYREKYSTKVFYEKRIKRVLIPFLFWTIAYYIFDSRFYAFPGPIFQSQLGIRNFVTAFANNNINNLFWFFYAILALYLVTPMLSILAKSHKKLLLGIVFGYFVFSDLLDYFSKLISINLDTRYINQPLIASSYLGYFVIGYLIKENYFSLKQENLLIIAGQICLILNIINAVTNNRYLLINNIGPFLYSVSFYLIVVRFVKHSHSNFKLAKWLSGASLGIYILHPIAYAIFDKIFFKTSFRFFYNYLKTLNNPIHILLMPFVVYFAIAISLHYLKRIKLVKALIP